MRYPKTILAYCLTLFTVMLGIVIVWVMISGKKSSGGFHGKFFEHVAPASSDIYRLKKVNRDGKAFYYVKRMGNEDNLNSDKNHPTNPPKWIPSEGD